MRIDATPICGSQLCLAFWKRSPITVRLAAWWSSVARSCGPMLSLASRTRIRKDRCRYRAGLCRGRKDCAASMARGGRGASDWQGTEERVAARAMMGRIGEPEDIANAVVFLVSPESGWITAQMLTVDGGRMDYIGHG